VLAGMGGDSRDARTRANVRGTKSMLALCSTTEHIAAQMKNVAKKSVRKGRRFVIAGLDIENEGR